MLNVIIRSIATILIGILLIMQRQTVMPIIVQCLGVAFILPALFVLLSHLLNKNRALQSGKVFVMTLLTSLGCMTFGLWLLLSPSFFVEVLMTLLGLLLSAFAIYQMGQLFLARRYCQVSFIMFILPAVLLLTGVVVLVKPFGAASLPFLLVGIGAVVSGISDLINTIFIKRHKKRYEKNKTTIMVESIEDN